MDGECGKTGFRFICKMQISGYGDIDCNADIWESRGRMQHVEDGDYLGYWNLQTTDLLHFLHSDLGERGV